MMLLRMGRGHQGGSTGGAALLFGRGVSSFVKVGDRGFQGGERRSQVSVDHGLN